MLDFCFFRVSLVYNPRGVRWLAGRSCRKFTGSAQIAIAEPVDSTVAFASVGFALGMVCSVRRLLVVWFALFALWLALFVTVVLETLLGLRGRLCVPSVGASVALVGCGCCFLRSRFWAPVGRLYGLFWACCVWDCRPSYCVRGFHCSGPHACVCLLRMGC